MFACVKRQDGRKGAGGCTKAAEEHGHFTGAILDGVRARARRISAVLRSLGRFQVGLRTENFYYTLDISTGKISQMEFGFY